MKGFYPFQYFRGKINDKRIAVKLKKKYNVDQDKHAYVIRTINDRAVQVAIKLLVVNIVRKNRPNQCNFGVIVYTEQYTEGFQMN